MGEEYKALLETKLRSLSGGDIRVFIEPAAVSEHYRKHLEETVLGVGAVIVSKRADANVVFGQSAASERPLGALLAFIDQGQMRFVGEPA